MGGGGPGANKKKPKHSNSLHNRHFLSDWSAERAQYFSYRLNKSVLAMGIARFCLLCNCRDRRSTLS